MKAILFLSILFIFSCAKEVQPLIEEPTIETLPAVPEVSKVLENPNFYNLFFSIQRKYKKVLGDTILISPHGDSVFLTWNQRPSLVAMYSEFKIQDQMVGLFIAICPNCFKINQMINGLEVIDTVTTSREREEMCYQTFRILLRKNNCPIIGD